MTQIFTALFALILTTSAQAQMSCFGEAQIIAKVSESRGVTSGRCQLTVLASDIKFYSENQLCPLSIDEVLVKGVLVRADNFQCAVNVNETISGILVLQEDGTIVLE